MRSNPIRYLVLWLTTDCNLQCAYCYRGEPPSRSMPVEIARSALELAAASGLPFHVQLAGGEPLLEPQLVAILAEMVREAGWPATLAIQTNGTMLDGCWIELCRRYGIGVGVSLDGPPAVQEQVRGGAAATFHGLRMLSEASLPVRITTVLSTANVLRLKELILSLAVFPTVEGIALDPLVLRGRAVQAQGLVPSNFSIGQGIRSMLTSLKLVNTLRTQPIRWRELDAVERALRGDRPSRAYCHACLGESLAVHPDGTVYPCSQVVGDPAWAVGTVESVDWRKLRNAYHEVKLRGDCDLCLLDGRCPGDCPSRLLSNRGLSRHVVCAVYQAIAELLAVREES
ncbi:MAG: radical SAM protein [Syntrophobacteraceae bacterium]|nr:radical SAM protein [Syntrophobacteraceae bacterium]